MADIQDTITQNAEQVLADLRTLRDRIRVRAHLASMDAKTAWEALEPKVHQFEREVEQSGAHLAETLRDRWAELRKSLTKLDDAVG